LLSLAGYLIMNSPAEIPVIARQSERLGELIEERIVTGPYPPGTRLDEQELASTFGVSRTPVREALIQLASIGLIEIRPRRGATVPEIGADRVCEMFEVMAELEVMCGRLAARRITASEQLALQEAHRACEAARDANTPDVYYQLNEVFHQRIYEASHNSFLVEQATALHRRLRPYRRLQSKRSSRATATWLQHNYALMSLFRANASPIWSPPCATSTPALKEPRHPLYVQ
jgi:DNA-binding GntR family transcriptional regulator